MHPLPIPGHAQHIGEMQADSLRFASGLMHDANVIAGTFLVSILFAAYMFAKRKKKRTLRHE